MPRAACREPHRFFDAHLHHRPLTTTLTSLLALTKIDPPIPTQYMKVLELEPDCKWVLAASAFLSEQLAGCAKGDGGGGGAEAAAEAAAHAQKLRELGRVDPLRGRYYADRAAAVAVE